MTRERRAFSRITFDADTTLRQEEHSWSAVLIDISLKGVLVEEPFGLNFDFELPLQVEIRLSDDTSIHMKAFFRHHHNNQMGFECQHIDIDSISHLRRLVELNTGNPELLERELAALGT